jgi:hypothetical protein
MEKIVLEYTISKEEYIKGSRLYSWKGGKMHQ